MDRWEDIYDFWFGAPGSDAHGEVREMWFRGGPEVDREISDRFADDYRRAAAGELDGWRDAPRSAVALVVLLDQFPRNIFRGDPQSFAADGRALSVANHIVASPWHDDLLAVERVFAYLPFEHSEDIADQERCVALFVAMEDHPSREEWLDYAVQHKVIIEQFGRFPHRNAILGRANTPEEDAWLSSTDQRFGTDTDDDPDGTPE